jgi:ribosomal protein S18 acetylase RimI-like enzyme
MTASRFGAEGEQTVIMTKDATILTRDASPSDLLHAFDDNFEACVALAAAKWPQAIVEETPAGFLLISGLPTALGNVVCRTRLSEADAAEWVRKIQARCAERDLPMLWLVGPRTTPATLGDVLREAGFSRGVTEAMALDLAKAALEAPRIDGLHISEVETEEQMSDFHAAMHGFKVKADTLEGYMRKLWGMGCGPASPARHFVGYLEGKPVSCSSVGLYAGVAGIYDVSTLDDYRRRGLATALTAHACLVGAANGYRYCMLDSSARGIPLYLRMGFTSVGQYGRYIWPPERW